MVAGNSTAAPTSAGNSNATPTTIISTTPTVTNIPSTHASSAHYSSPTPTSTASSVTTSLTSSSDHSSPTPTSTASSVTTSLTSSSDHSSLTPTSTASSVTASVTTGSNRTSHAPSSTASAVNTTSSPTGNTTATHNNTEASTESTPSTAVQNSTKPNDPKCENYNLSCTVASVGDASFTLKLTYNISGNFSIPVKVFTNPNNPTHHEPLCNATMNECLVEVNGLQSCTNYEPSIEFKMNCTIPCHNTSIMTNPKKGSFIIEPDKQDLNAFLVVQKPGSNRCNMDYNWSCTRNNGRSQPS
ncbi:putative GPI-anchored protein pfl2 [Amblyraja radiata]|uniref:putative GPI-anchored protein pfl2 n=1 Tax=Amblyraja radiata TaxID=386614 RepID=UPI0014031B9D|nr:putative GPI-anchored protein pfl2 [Amblyraja radiata]